MYEYVVNQGCQGLKSLHI